MTDYTAKIAALEEAIASGELTVEADGDRVTYRKMAELLQARDMFVALSVANDGDVRPATTVAIFQPY